MVERVVRHARCVGVRDVDDRHAVRRGVDLRIRAAVGNQIRMIPVEDVLYFEATDKYINVVCAEQASLIRMSLRELLPQLDPQIFWQIHRSYIINSRYLQFATRDETGKLSVQLKGSNQKLQVSRVYAHLFKQM